MKAILGKKIKMSQVFDDKGKPIPVTLVSAGPCFVTSLKTKEKDNYSAVQLGYDKTKKLNKPEAGKLKKAKIDKKLKTLREFRIDNTDGIKIGDEVNVSIFKDNEKIEITAISKGKGFAGVIKRHGFHRGPETHGSDHHRHPGSIGSMFPQRVVKGRKMPGHAGNEQITIKKTQIIKIIPETNIIMIKGAVPGPNKGLVKIFAKENNEN